MHVVMDDGTEADVGPGDVVAIEPGHDAWVVGDESFLSVDFGGYAQYAKAASASS
jgi:NADPH:quinone reductase-like Zn-dependent oxidoreductase